MLDEQARIDGIAQHPEGRDDAEHGCHDHRVFHGRLSPIVNEVSPKQASEVSILAPPATEQA